MNVLILSRKAELFSTRRLANETAALGHQPIVQDPDDPLTKRTDAHVVIPRFGTYRFRESLKVLEHFERLRIPVLNRAVYLAEARNKWMSYLVLREAGLPVPHTTMGMKKELPKTYPYVAKIPEGTKGEGVFLIAGPQDLLRLPDGEWLAQEFFPEAKGRDHRVLVLDGEVIAAMERTAAPGDFRSNIAQGGVGAPLSPSTVEKEIAIHATKALGLKFAGVDLIPTRNGPIILEVNGTPGLQGVEEATKINIAKRIVAAAVALAQPPK